MGNRVKVLGTIIIVLGLVTLIVGAVFIQQGFAKEAFLVNAMNEENIALPGGEGEIVNTSALAEQAAEVVREHRQSIAPTYDELLAGGRFDPANPAQLSYGQAMNIENYLFLSVTAFGVFTVVKATGAAMIVIGLASGAAGFAIRKLAV